MDRTADALAIRRAVACFVTRIAADPELAVYLGRIDEARVRRYVRAFALGAIGGPELPPDDLVMRRSVALDDPAFDRIEASLGDALREAGLSVAVVDLVLRRAESMRRVLVTG